MDTEPLKKVGRGSVIHPGLADESMKKGAGHNPRKK